MKTKILVLLLAWGFIGCDGFLEEKSQTEIRPSTILDMEKLLEGEGYWTDGDATFTDATDIFTDNVTCKVVGKTTLNVKIRDRYKYIWDNSMFDDNGEGADISFWKTPYKYIKGCNVILEYIDDMITDGEEDRVKREHLRGEAYVLRGLYHFYLVNFFGLPYNYGDPTQNPGIPLKISSGVNTDERPTRASVADCYKQIEKDLQEGTALMSSSRSEASLKVNRIDYLVGHALLSRMYLYMEDWDNAIKYADSVLQVKPELRMFSENPDNYAYTGKTNNVESLWEMPTNNAGYIDGIGPRTTLYPYSAASNDLINVFGEDLKEGEIDLRMMTQDEDNEDYPGYYGRSVTYLQTGGEAIYDDNDNKLGYNEYYVIYKGYEWTGLRTAELYLNRAEAYIEKYIEEGDVGCAQLALDDLNYLRMHRLDPNGFTVKEMSDFSDGQALLEFCQRERRRELCGEGNHRWFDLRRQGMPAITHVYLDNDTGMESRYELQQEDRRYVLPIPRDVRDRNQDLEQNKY